MHNGIFRHIFNVVLLNESLTEGLFERVWPEGADGALLSGNKIATRFGFLGLGGSMANDNRSSSVVRVHWNPAEMDAWSYVDFPALTEILMLTRLKFAARIPICYAPGGVSRESRSTDLWQKGEEFHEERAKIATTQFLAECGAEIVPLPRRCVGAATVGGALLGGTLAAPTGANVGAGMGLLLPVRIATAAQSQALYL